MKMSRWRMICVLKFQLFCTLTFNISIIFTAIWLLYDFIKRDISVIIPLCLLPVFLYAYSLQFGYLIDIMFKNIAETDWVSGENIGFVRPISGATGEFIGCKINVQEEGRKSKQLNFYKKLAPWPDGDIAEYKIFYLKICKAVVGWKVIYGGNEK